MKLYFQGDNGKAVCGKCAGIVPMTFQYRDVPFSDKSGMVKDILVGVCDKCNSVIAVPPQSTPAIKSAKKEPVKSIEAKVPAIYIDALNLASYRIDPNLTTDFRKRLLMYFVHRCITDKRTAKSVTGILHKEQARFEESGGTQIRKRLSMKVSPDMADDFKKAMSITNMNKTRLIKSLVLQITNEIVKPKKPKHIKELKSFAAASMS